MRLQSNAVTLLCGPGGRGWWAFRKLSLVRSGPAGAIAAVFGLSWLPLLHWLFTRPRDPVTQASMAGPASALLLLLSLLPWWYLLPTLQQIATVYVYYAITSVLFAMMAAYYEVGWEAYSNFPTVRKNVSYSYFSE